ncbi:SDR family NAD(P)-dependent oxidoreductase [Paraburkholderia dinghuensis]|uniref:SDR family oxidoreductase n=1 Tax=Paraburkholderia dinghuensis TaxID=2305225 RepID=A0A3N6MTV9_9BURK|nr:SDR family oxidoreductase [Paraburkholderia dinghuensis]RQH07089.1 SDR family oxidoreductase [Paraburkholderia dinghuensis]
MNTLAGKTAIVTGASRGSGRAAALALAKAGAQVIVHYRHSANEAQAVVAEIRGIGSRSDAIAADLSSPDGPHRLARRVRGIVGDRLDILVANAGIQTHAAAGDTSIEDFTRQFALNVRAPYFLVQQLLPIICKGSSVVFQLPFVAHAAATRGASDAAIGGAVQTMTRHLALALGERGVRVNALLIAPAMGQPANAGRTVPEGLGTAVTFLASDAARWITGEIVQINDSAELSREQACLAPCIPTVATTTN